MRDKISLALALFGIVNIGVGAWGVIYLINNIRGGVVLFLCLFSIAIGVAMIKGATR